VTRAAAISVLIAVLMGLAGCINIPARLAAEFKAAPGQAPSHFRKPDSPPAPAEAAVATGETRTGAADR
jgi:hypothetical protein